MTGKVLKYSSGEVPVMEKSMERSDNEWCRIFFSNEYGENNDETESASYVSPRVHKEGD